MMTRSFSLEVLTACFCSGANPTREAEIRTPSIRGQLRWWFRTLGGFRSLASKSLPQQETEVFGSGGNLRRQASTLILRVSPISAEPLRTVQVRNADGLNAPLGSDRGYLLFPLARTARAVFEPPRLPRFELAIQWRGDPKLWEDVQALVTVLGHLGSLGLRARRAMGALGFRESAPALKPALARFNASAMLHVKSLPARDSQHAVSVLAHWLKKWRSYGRTMGNQLNRFRPGFDFARNDHDAGLGRHAGPVFRPALGLPIEQGFSSTRRVVNWDEFWDPKERRARGRFASPILLRPYRTPQRGWLALVIFADSHQWPAGKKAFLNGQPRSVSPDLYEAMKRDRDLQDLSF